MAQRGCAVACAAQLLDGKGAHGGKTEPMHVFYSSGWPQLHRHLFPCKALVPCLHVRQRLMSLRLVPLQPSKWSSTSHRPRSVSASGAARAEPSVRYEPTGRPAALSSWDATAELEAWAHDPTLKPSTHVVASRTRQLSHGLRRLRPAQLAAVAGALAAMGHHPGEDWLSELDAICYSHPGPFDPASSTTLVNALAQLHKASHQLQQQHHHSHQLAHTSHPHWREKQRPHCNGPRPHHPNLSSTAKSSSTSSHSSTPTHPPEPAPFRFPQAVYLRLSNPSSQSSGTASYSYEQLAVLLQSFRSLGMEVGDDVALAIGARMAAQLMDMGPERRTAALQAVVGGAA